ncbi:MAG: DUF1294 domain-containing protein [Oscillospiraceae bacterium]
MELWQVFLYYIFISVVAMFITIYDKNAAINHNWRISELTLMVIGILGGALAMLITMKKIRHKTKHRLFMVGLPAEIVIHFFLLSFIVYKNFFY